MRELKSLLKQGAGLSGALLFVWASAAMALTGALTEDIRDRIKAADIVLLGEVHDNPAHHQVQSEFLTLINPRAVVWEMITADQAALLRPDLLADAETLKTQLDWDSSGWPDFALYAPLFAATTEAAHFGAMVPRSASAEIMQDGIVAWFGADAVAFGLDQPLPEAEQAEREADQMANHCDALPEDLLPMMVDFQRLRDGELARVALRALKDTGGPVAVITGNGHARSDRGVPVYLLQAAPDLQVFSLGQSEEGGISGQFDLVMDAPAEERPDPCLAFAKD